MKMISDALKYPLRPYYRNFWKSFLNGKEVELKYLPNYLQTDSNVRRIFIFRSSYLEYLFENRYVRSEVRVPSKYYRNIGRLLGLLGYFLRVSRQPIKRTRTKFISKLLSLRSRCAVQISTVYCIAQNYTRAYTSTYVYTSNTR